MLLGSRLTAARAAALALAGGGGLWACSADVQGYHLFSDGVSRGSGGDTMSGGGNGVSGNRSGAGGSTAGGGRTTILPSGGAGGGGEKPDSSITSDGGQGGLGGDGGSGGLGGGGASNGGASNGGASNGGTSAGGTSAGGTSAGGTSAGGTSSGGAGTGGAGTGGVGTGGAGTGGTGGTWPGNPVLVTASGGMTGITAAAWESTSQHFFLLKASTKEVYDLNPATGAVATPVTLPGTKVAPAPFGVSASSLYFVADNTLYRVTHAGAVTTSAAASVAPSTDTQWNGAYAAGWFVVGYPLGATQALPDGMNAVSMSAKSLTKLNGVVTDGSSFVFTMASPSTPEAWVQRLAPGSFTVAAGHCSMPSSYLNTPLSTYGGTTVAWVQRSAQSYNLNVATLTATACSSTGITPFGMASAGSGAVGLLDDRYAIVTSLVGAPSVTMTIEDSQGLPGTPVTNGFMGSGLPQAFVMGTTTPTHYAVLVTGDRPVIVRF